MMKPEITIDNDTILDAQNLKKYFEIKMGFLKSLTVKSAPYVHAVDDISFSIKKEEVFGLVGESGCGKTTTGRLLLRLIEPTSGKILLRVRDRDKADNETERIVDITTLSLEREMRRLRRKMQIIFQDPYESLNPRMSIFDILAEPLRIQRAAKTEEEVRERVHKILEDMDLVPAQEFVYRFPHELSGGQRQRVAIARAFILDPEFIVADEPVSMLDASIRSEVAKLMLNLVHKFHCSYLYITHDVALARYMCDRIAVMYLGKIAEKGPTESIIQKPLHPYTEALLAAVPVPDPTARRAEVVIKGEIPSAVNPPAGCRFHTRCPSASDICRREEPKLIEMSDKRLVACHKYTK